MNKNSNSYQILYAAVMVVLVGAMLAFIYMALKPRQEQNIANDKRNQILSAIHQATANESEIPATYQKFVVKDLCVDAKGAVVDSAAGCAFNVDMKKNMKLPEAERKLPVLVCDVEGQTKYVIPVYGAGLWGPIWGYVAVNDDGNTIFGAYFSHESETPGLGARIADADFQDQFKDKALYKEGAFKNVTVVKKGQTPNDGSDYVDAISGATITSRGVGAMMQQCMAAYDPFFKSIQSRTE